MTKDQNADARAALKNVRGQALSQLEDWMETPMLVLGFVWLALMLWEYVRGISPLLETVVNVIWIIFVLDFAVKFILAPDKTDYLKSNWLTLVALAVPALREELRAFARRGES
jgi:voltage-gated potassium channel